MSGRRHGIVSLLVASAMAVVCVSCQKPAAQPASLPVQAAEPLRFGVASIYDVKSTLALFQPCADILTEALGRPVRVVTAEDINSFIQRAASGDYDFVWITIYGYMELQEQAGWEILASGRPEFRGIAVVRTDSAIQTPADLKGARVAAVSPRSFGGYLFLRPLVKEAGLSMDTDMSVSFHDSVQSLPFLVVNGKADVALFGEDSYARSPVYNSTKDQLRVIAVSPPIPQFPFAAAPDLPPDIKDGLRETLGSISGRDERERTFLKGLVLERMAPAKDEDYAGFLAFYKAALE